MSWHTSVDPADSGIHHCIHIHTAVCICNVGLCTYVHTCKRSNTSDALPVSTCSKQPVFSSLTNVHLPVVWTCHRQATALRIEQLSFRADLSLNPTSGSREQGRKVRPTASSWTFWNGIPSLACWVVRLSPKRYFGACKDGWIVLLQDV